jgi:lipopolysaccharide/colanic/teichoic acid biosynthesis glycosyltransferase
LNALSRSDFVQLFNRALEPSSVALSHYVASSALPPIQTGDRELRFENPSASNWSLSRAKRILDLSVALPALLLLAAPILVIAICVRLTSKGPAFFIQKRVGRGGRLFGICKFRSMAVGAGTGPGLTGDGDRRVTGFGRWMRRFKLDELPQFYNILRGEMSLVGPRPKLPQYEAIVNMPYRPGITGAATLAFRREEKILSDIQPSQLDVFYAQRIKPLKARIDVRYMSRATFMTDMRLIVATLRECMTTERISATRLSSTEQNHASGQTNSRLDSGIEEIKLAVARAPEPIYSPSVNSD